MKIHILFSFREKSWGGGNQFLKTLRQEFRRTNRYAESLEYANVILFNSHHDISRVVRLRRTHSDITFLHRLDGPLGIVRGTGPTLDQAICQANMLLADGTIFQSQWSQEANKSIHEGITVLPYTLIPNAPDPAVFRPKSRVYDSSSPMKVIITSWSSNMRKGFSCYQFLDEHHDPRRLSISFVGNSPIKFKKIKMSPPVDSKSIAERLRQHDTYLTASQTDPCSNSLLEALHCGLPAVARDDGGHPELIGGSGVLFRDDFEVIDALEVLRRNYDGYSSKISVGSISEVADAYCNFASLVQNRRTSKSSISLWDASKLLLQLEHSYKRKILSLLDLIAP
tara:strand:+ start:3998 stop:5014 length:1017 start_codon:yes stop_codon:yes gene_type:complete